MTRIHSIVWAVAVATAVTLSSCDPNPYSVSEDVDIEMAIEQVSAAFCRVSFTPSDEAYYLAGVEEVRPGTDPSAYSKQFMNLTLDSAYIQYLTWRHDLLLNGVAHVADFCDHSLQYSASTITFQFLKPNTEYWLFAFVVNKDTNKPVGKLHLMYFMTAAEGQVPVYFDYRINGTWDNVYPKDSLGELETDVPWVGATIDSLKLREMGVRVPGVYFADTFAIISQDKKARILYGVYSHNNDGVGDGTSTTKFEVGHTYYTGVASLDGPILSGSVPKYYDIFRFTWQGDSTQLYLTHEKDNTHGAW